MIHIRTLGPAEITLGVVDPPAALRWQKNIALIVYLAHAPNRTRSREHLIGLLWPDKDDKSARHSLREALRPIRQQLGDEGLDTSGTTVRLTNDQVSLDTDDLERLAAAGQWREAAELIRGEFLEGMAIPGASEFEDWLTTERHVWRERSVNVLVHAARDTLAEGRPDRARQFAERAAQLDPTSDLAAQILIEVAALDGNRAGAIAVYDAFAARLEDHVGLAPSSRTMALVQRVRDDPAWGLGDRVAVEDGAPSRRPPLFGRDRELRTMLEHLETCFRTPQATVFLLEGDSGLGKTRLAQEVVSRARLMGAMTSTVRSVDADRTNAWSGLTGLVRGGLLDASGVGGADPGAIAALLELAPECADRFGPAVRRAAPTPPLPAMSETLRAVTDEQPAVLFFDDAQHLDDETASALEAALRDLADRPVCIVLAVIPRDEHTAFDTLRTRIGRDLDGNVARLLPLAADATLELVRWAFPDLDDEQSERTARRIAMDSAGIPLLSVELLHAVALGLQLENHDRTWPAPARTLSETRPGDLPDPVVAAIRIGFRRLSPEAQRVLQVAAVLGDRTPPKEFARRSGLSQEATDKGLDEVEWHRWLTAEGRGYSFVARIVREVVARDMVTSRQRQQIVDAE